MSGRKKKNKHRSHQDPPSHQQGAPSDDLLDELSNLRDLLGSDELGDIPLLDQVAAPARAAAAPAAPATAPQQPRPEPLDESDLPILFSPVDEELPDDYRAELNESDRALLRPLQDLPATEPGANTGAQPQTAAPREQQQELFAGPGDRPATENPFLPAHIRARLTGGRVPKHDEPPLAPAATASAAATADSAPHSPPAEALPATAGTSDSVDAAASEGSAAAQGAETDGRSAARNMDTGNMDTGNIDTGNTDTRDTDTQATASPHPESAPQRGEGQQSEAGDQSERGMQRQLLVDRLVAKQLPELERQLRARIELMVDELEAKR